MRGGRDHPIGSLMTCKHKNRELQLDFGSKGALLEMEEKARRWKLKSILHLLESRERVP